MQKTDIFTYILCLPIMYIIIIYLACMFIIEIGNKAINFFKLQIRKKKSKRWLNSVDRTTI